MNLKLLLDNHEIDLQGNETFPLNKTFSNLDNPSDIINEYSKSINIPMSQANNKILANSYRLDRSIVKDGTANIGLYLDPNKRIPMVLLHNESILIDGYAKYVSSTQGVSGGYYTLNLFGALGDVFYELMKVVCSVDQLSSDDIQSDGNKYVLNDYQDGSVNYDSEFVSNSFITNQSNSSSLDQSTSIYDIYGAAPSYRGFYPNFKSDKIQTSTEEIQNISDYLKDKWINTYLSSRMITNPSEEDIQEATEYVEALDPESVVGDGFKDYLVGDYRANKMRPFIYFNKLMYMFQQKISEISDYTLVLDNSWFNDNNPYWAKLVYMFDFLQKRGQDMSDSFLFSSPLSTDQNVTTAWKNGGINKSVINFGTKNVFTTSNTLSINPSTIYLDLKLNRRIIPYHFETTPDISPQNSDIINPSVPEMITGGTLHMNNNTFIKLTFNLKQNSAIVDNKVFWATLTGNNAGGYTPDGYTNDNTLILQEGSNSSLPEDIKYSPTIDEWCGYINVPSMIFDGNFNDDYTIDLDVEMYCGTTKATSIEVANHASTAFFYIDYFNQGYLSAVAIEDSDSYFFYGSSLKVGVLATEYIKTETIPVQLGSFYKLEEPIFNVILQYTKMFGLIWDMDYATKTINLMRRESYFNNYSVTNWDDKIDLTKNIVVEPVSFPTQYIKFSYDDVDGYNYSSYKDKYGSSYGDKIIRTAYSFNSSDTNIFSGIKPSMASNRPIITLDDYYNWNLSSTIKSQRDPVLKIECASADDSSSIETCRWCFRNENIAHSAYVSNDTSIMTNESCYIKPGLFSAPTMILVESFPIYAPIYIDGYYSCLFNTPMVDYTTDKIFSLAKGNAIYDVCWNNFINERYNAQNKKLTAYFNINLVEFSNFKFNNLVVVDNQMFMVNKIIDFEPTTNTSTKCELLQVGNINNYTTPFKTFI